MAKDARKLMTLECVKCKDRSYHTPRRVKGQDVKKFEAIKKHCPTCNTHTEHKETK